VYHTRLQKKLTIKRRVTEENIDEVKTWIDNGRENHPGMNYVFQPDGRRRRLTDENQEDLKEMIEPGEGWEVERHLQDGDTVLFNRQPSLHRMSIMAHEVVYYHTEHSESILTSVHLTTQTSTGTR